MKLLLAEDDPEPAEHIVDALQGRAHTVRDVGDGTEGLGRPPAAAAVRQPQGLAHSGCTDRHQHAGPGGEAGAG